MKYKRVAGLAFVAMFATLAITLPMGVWAEGDDADTSDSEATVSSGLTTCEGISNCAVVTSDEELYNFFTVDDGRLVREGEATLIIGDDFTMAHDYHIKDAKLDIYLGDHTITADDYSLLFYNSTVNIYGGTGALTNVAAYYSPLYVRAGSTVTVYGGTISGGQELVTISEKTYEPEGGVVVDEEGMLVLEGGVITSKTWGLTVWKNAAFIMNGGEVKATGEGSIGVSGYGAAKGEGAKITVNSGTITSGELGVYAPQINGVTTINGGTINGLAGVEVRAGTLNITGGTINIPADTTFDISANGSGSTTMGTAIAVAQHTTKQPIVVTVSGGTFTAPVPFSEANPQYNSEEAIEKVSLSITGGKFSATNGDPIVASEDVVKFISGGEFNKVPKLEFVVDGKDVYDLGPDGPYVVDDATTVSLPEETVYVKLGDTMDLGGYLTNIAKKYGTFGVAEDAAMTIGKETLVATATKTGTAIINFQLHNYKNEVDKSFSVVVYGIDSEDDANKAGSDEETHNEDLMASATNGATRALLDSLDSYANASIENPGSVTLADGTKAEITANATEISRALANGGKIVAKLVEADVALNDTDSAKVKAKMAEGAKVAKTLDYAILLSIDSSNDSTMLGKITETATDLGITVDVSGVEAEEDGYRRAYQVIRLHDGEEEATVLGGTYSTTDKTVSFASNKFSTFTLAYVDTQVVIDNGDDNTEDAESTETPDTGTFTGSETSVSAGNVVAIVAALAVITAVVVGAVKFAKR